MNHRVQSPSYWLWKQPPAQRYHTGKGWMPGSAGGKVVQLGFSAPLSTQQSRVRFHPWVSERTRAWHLGGFSARSLQRECCYSRNSASTSAHSTSQFDLRDNIKVWFWTSHWRHWGPSESLSRDHRSLRLSWRHSFTGHYHSQFVLRVDGFPQRLRTAQMQVYTNGQGRAISSLSQALKW